MTDELDNNPGTQDAPVDPDAPTIPTAPSTGAQAVAAAIRGSAPDPEPDPATPETSEEEDTTDQPSDAFDRERAMRTIARLREIEKRAKVSDRQLKETAEKLSTYQQREKEAEEAALSEQQRLTKQKAELEQTLAEQQRRHQDQTNRYEVQLAAGRLGIIDPDAAEKLLDWSAIEYDAAGRPTDLDGALKRLVKERPYLQGQPQVAAPRPAVANPATRSASAPGQRVYSSAEINDYPFYLKHRDDIQAAMGEPGRPRIEP